MTDNDNQQLSEIPKEDSIGVQALKEARMWGKLQSPFDLSTDHPVSRSYANDTYVSHYHNQFYHSSN